MCVMEAKGGSGLYSVAGIFELMNAPVYFIGVDLEARPLNNLAHRLAAGENGLRLEGGRLMADFEADQVRLDHQLKLVVADHRRAPAALNLRRRSAPTPLHLLVTGIAEGDGRKATFLLVGDPERARRTPPALLRAWYGLTHREAELASHLASGLAVDEVAGCMGIAVATVRTHLKNVYTKTGAETQLKLVSMITSMPTEFHKEPAR